MKIFKTIGEMRLELACESKNRNPIGFVPTMGALHDGHLTLMRTAISENARIVASIFVNPTQFNDPSDLEKYPRDMDTDLRLLEEVDVDYVFAPSVEEMYPAPIETVVDVPALSSQLIGKLRPGHFQGMASVVVKLLNIIGADRAYFGEKDYQQLAIVRKMVTDLNIPTEVCGVPTVREPDGLAMSSRNQLLSVEDRKAASIIYRSIKFAQSLSLKTIPEIEEKVRAFINEEPRASVENVDIVDAYSLTPMQRLEKEAVLLLNVKFGDVLLIDQAKLSPV